MPRAYKETPLPEISLEQFLANQEGWFACGEHRMNYIGRSAAEPLSPSRPAVVFVHGLMGYSFSWRHNLEAFAHERDVFAVDLLGIGRSERPPAADYGMGAAASRVLSFLRSLGCPRVDLVGTSHGGAIAMLAAAEDRLSSQPLIRRLVLVDPANPFMRNARFRLAFFRTALGRLVLRQVIARSELLLARSMGRMYADESRMTQEMRAGYELNLRDASSYEYALAVIRTWKEDMRQLRAALPSIADVPTLLLWGEQDHVVSPASGLQLQRHLRQARYQTMPGVGHMPYEEAPEQFNRAVLEFLDSED